MRKKYLLLFLLNLVYITLFSQQYFFRNFSIDKGLPQSSVYCLLQDSRGYIWMGTDGGGVCKYDGKNIEIINKNSGLTGNIVRSLFEDSKGNIWIGTDNGITIYDGINYKAITQDQGYDGSFALKILESKDHNIWIATNDAGLYKINYTDSINLSNYSIHNGLLNSFIFDIEEDSAGKIWLAMIGGINILDCSNSTLNIDKLIQYRDLPSGFITCLEFTDKDELIVGTYDSGAFKIKNPTDLNNIKIENFSNNILSSENTIWDIHYKKNNEILFATNDFGILKLNTNNKVVKYNKENSFETNLFFDILEDTEGNLWYASFGSGVYTYIGDELISYNRQDVISEENITSLNYTNDKLYIGSHEGLNVFKITDKTVKLEKSYNIQNGLTDNKVNTIAIDTENRIWLGVNNGINVIDKNNIKLISKSDGIIGNKISTIFIDNKETVWVGTDDGYNKIEGNKVYSFSQEQGFINGEVQTIIQDKKERIWMGTLGGLVCLDGSKYTDYNEVEGLTNLRIHSLAEDREGNIWIGTFGGGIFKFDNKKDSLPINLIADKNILSSNNIYSLIFSNDTSLIVGTDKGFDYVFLNQKLEIEDAIAYDANDGFTTGENNLNAITKDSNNAIWFGTTSGIIRFNPEPNIIASKPQIYLTNLKLFHKDINWGSKNVNINKWFNVPEYYEFSNKENHLTFNYSGIYYKNSEDLEYSYFLEGQSIKWSPYSKSNNVVFQGLSPGDYTFRIKAKNKLNIESDINEFSFKIKPPFYLTWWFILSSTAIFIIAIILFIRYREAKLRQDKIKLERTVHERTIEIVKQKNEIEKQRDIVTSQKQEITDSIHYAQTIQKAVLPKERILEEAFSEHFIFFRPKDIVSGDFYWISKKNNHVIFTAADCTGHGVPGAFMSMLGVSFLNKIVNEQGITQPDIILNKLRENIIDSLQQKGLPNENKDGMDISICSINIQNRKLQFAGANNPMLLIKKRNKEIILDEIKADRMPVAIYSIMNDFTNNEIQLEKGDSIYLFSDGYIDQFGGPKGKKLMKKNFKNLILENQNKDMTEQKGILTQNIEDWMKYKTTSNLSFEQIDDIIVMGVKI